MKTKNVQLIKTSVFSIILSTFMLISCQNDGIYIDENGFQLDEASAIEQTEIDNVSEGINAIIEDVYYNEENQTAAKGIDVKNKFIPNCATITKVITKDNKKITIDFGDGCETKNGNIVSGIINMEYNYNISELSVSIDYAFDNFYFNGKKVEGTINKIRIRFNENGNPEATINKNIKIIWEDETFVTVNGERVREWIKGVGSSVWGDNVFLITGKWSITKKDGTNRTAIIIEPLRREMSCRFIVSGKTKIESGGKSILLDYGNGECDDLAIATINGKEIEIHLSKIKR